MAISQRQLFLDHLAQTTNYPMGLEVDKAEGLYIYSTDGKRYMDLISGISVSNVGHRHPKVVEAIKDQVDRFMHLMVYGEYIQAPQVKLATAIASELGDKLEVVYFVNSGSEANEGALKLAKRYTGRPEVIYMKDAYHGSTSGALSVMGNETFKQAFAPLIPGCRPVSFNEFDDLEAIGDRTAAVIVEPIMSASGYTCPKPGYLKALKEKCQAEGALLIFDEVQTGFGRTGKIFAHHHFDVEPDIMTIAKGMGGGMPIGAFVSSSEIMSSLKEDPMLGHITTFGGHPVSCASSLASLEVIQSEGVMETIEAKEKLFRKLLSHPKILEIRGKGLLLAVHLKDFETVQKVAEDCLENGLILNWFLSCYNALRITPPLTITEEEIEEACQILLDAIDKA